MDRECIYKIAGKDYMEKYSFCTHFDINYVAQAKALYSSLEKTGEPFELYMFCMCNESYAILSSEQLPHAKIFSYEQLEAYFPELLTAKNNRSKVEYFYTCSPAICSYLMQQYPQTKMLTYLDADLYFFNSFTDIFEEISNHSIGIIEHKFSWTNRRNIIYGRFNVGWVSFRNDTQGRSCLNNWFEKCLEWCYHRIEGDKYGDQKYLNTWPDDYSNTHIIQHKGANVAMWNVGNYKLSKKGNMVYIDEQPLIFYHFASLKQMDDTRFKTNLSKVLVATKGILRDDIYLPYIKNIIANSGKRIVFIKKDTHIPNRFRRMVNFSRNLREILFPDIVDI